MNHKEVYKVISGLLKTKPEGLTDKEIQKILHLTGNELREVLNKNRDDDIYCELSCG